MALLQLGMAGGRPVKAVLADARAGKPLAADEWRLLAFYSWDTDEAAARADGRAAGAAGKLAAACPRGRGETRDPAVAEGAGRRATTARASSPTPRCASGCSALLADPARDARQMDVLDNNAADIVTRARADGRRRAQRAGRARSTPRCSAWRPTRRCRAPTAVGALVRARRSGAPRAAEGRAPPEAAGAAAEGGARTARRATTARSPTATSARR